MQFSVRIIIGFWISIFCITVEARRWISEENIAPGKVAYRVFEEIPSLRKNQNQVSQDLIFKTIDSPNRAVNFSKYLRSTEHTGIKHELLQPGSPLWVPHKRSWTLDDEEDYRQWFSANVNTQMLKSTGVIADCADVGLLLRWIYAREKKLPIANTLQGAGKLFGHFSGSAAWDKLPSDPDWTKDERFKAALRYLFRNTYTRSVIEDLYPTEITPKFVHEGSVYMIIRPNSGHFQTIQYIDAQRIGIKTVWGNQPGTESIFDSWIIWEPTMRNLFGMWRWPVIVDGAWSLKPASQMPGYSKEQFIKRKELGEADFRIWVYGRLGLVDYEEVRLNRMLGDMKANLNYRLPVTAMGAMICGINPCDPKGLDYDNYSTDSRDARLKQYQEEALKLIAALGGINSPTVTDIITQLGLESEFLTGLGIRYVDFLTSETLLKNIKPGANFNFLERWGIEENSISIPVQYQSLHQQLRIVFGKRIEFVNGAGYYCKNGCDPDPNHWLKAYTTTQMDQGLAMLAEKNSLFLQNPAVPVDLFDHVANAYRNIPLFGGLNIKDSFCENRELCTLHDVVIKDNRFQYIKQWTSNYYDSTKGRWGIP